MRRRLKDYIHELRWDFYKRRLYWRGQRASRRIPFEKMEEPIDFVVAWVDGADPKWVADRNSHAREAGLIRNADDNGEERYRDWDIFQYWFRAVEKYAPWVQNVYFLTYGHLPEWMNPEAPKLKIVKHEDYIPREHLPVFSSAPIELNMHRIKGLGEHFVYFNDDMFLAQPVKPEDFFQGGKPNYTALALPTRPDSSSNFYHMLFNAYGVANRHFGNRIGQAIAKHPERWFAESYGPQAWQNIHAFEANYIQGMFFSHLGAPFRKSTLERVWEDVREPLLKSSSHPFRSSQDFTHQIFSLWEMIDGDFNPVSMAHHGRHFWDPSTQKDDIIDAILNPQYRMICINDSALISGEEYLMLKEELRAAFAKAFPEKSSFEK